MTLFLAEGDGLVLFTFYMFKAGKGEDAIEWLEPSFVDLVCHDLEGTKAVDSIVG